MTERGELKLKDVDGLLFKKSLTRRYEPVDKIQGATEEFAKGFNAALDLVGDKAIKINIVAVQRVMYKHRKDTLSGNDNVTVKAIKNACPIIVAETNWSN